MIYIVKYKVSKYQSIVNSKYLKIHKLEYSQMYDQRTVICIYILSEAYQTYIMNLQLVDVDIVSGIYNFCSMRPCTKCSKLYSSAVANAFTVHS